MRILCFLFVSTWIGFGLAKPVAALELTVLRKQVSMEKISNLGLYIEARCQNKNTTCLAASAQERAKKLTWSDLPKLDGVPDGPRMCIAMGGLTMTGRDQKLNEYALCEFKDKSLISSSALIGHLPRN